MIKNIIFDMGNVMMLFDGLYFISAVGIADESDKNILFNEIYHSVEWAQMDRGTLTLSEAEEQMKVRIPERLHPYVRKLVSNWDRPIIPVNGMADLVRNLKSNGYKIYLLSNAAENQPSYWNRVPGHEYFDGCLVSYEVKYVKPESEIFNIFLERFSLKAEECVFIDDSISNCEKALQLGITPIVFHGSADELCSKLCSLGVKVSDT